MSLSPFQHFWLISDQQGCSSSRQSAINFEIKAGKSGKAGAFLPEHLGQNVMLPVSQPHQWGEGVDKLFSSGALVHAG